MEINYDKNPTVFDKLLEPVLSFVQKQDQGLKKHPGQVLSFTDFFRMLIYYFVTSNEHSSIKIFIGLLKKGLIPKELNIPITPRSTFNDAFSRFSIDLFRDADTSTIKNSLFVLRDKHARLLYQHK